MAFREFATGAWWGGAGSIADVYLARETGVQFAATTNVDNQKFRAALIAIYDEMKAAGVIMQQAASWTDIFREWRAKGI